jgi:hypothetical protein
MKKEEPSLNIIRFAAESIMEDIRDRRGLKQILDMIFDHDQETYKDILNAWEFIILECFKKYEIETQKSEH